MRLRVNAQNLLDGAARGGFSNEGLEALMLQNALDHPHAVGPLGVAGSHVMGEAIAVGENERIQVDALPWFLQVSRGAAAPSIIICPLKPALRCVSFAAGSHFGEKQQSICQSLCYQVLESLKNVNREPAACDEIVFCFGRHDGRPPCRWLQFQKRARSLDERA